MASIVSTNTNNYVTTLFTVYYIQQRPFVPQSSVNKVNRLIIVETNGKITIVYIDMMLMSKNCSSMYFRRKTTVRAFTLWVTVMLLLTDFTSAPDDRSIGIEYCQKMREKVLRIPISILHTKSIADTCANTQKVSPILLVAVPVLRY